MYNSSTTTASDSHENVVFQGPKILGMSGDRYEDIVVKIPPSLDTSSLAGKSVLITGGKLVPATVHALLTSPKVQVVWVKRTLGHSRVVGELHIQPEGDKELSLTIK